MQFTELTFKRLLALVNAALWNSSIDSTNFENMDTNAWDELYQFSVMHGVFAVSFDGLAALPTSLQPPSTILLKWAYNTKLLEKKYTHIKGIVSELELLFKSSQIDVLFFKGLSLAENYPIPAHREFGDIDLYIAQKKNKLGEKLMQQLGIEKFKKNDKHTNFMYKGIMIESHSHFLDIKDSKKIKNLNQVLLNIISNKPTNKMWPPTEFTALFFMIHAIKHLSYQSLSLRTFCDWALFLNTHLSNFNITKWENVLKESGLFDIAILITKLTYEWLAIPTKFPLETAIITDKEAMIRNEILTPFLADYNKSLDSKFGVLKYKIKRFHLCNKRYVLLNGGNLYTYYISSFYQSFISHIHNPQTIFQIK